MSTSDISQSLWTNVPHGTVGIYLLNYLKMWSILVFFFRISENGLFLCLFIIIYCLISRKRQKLHLFWTFFTIHQINTFQMAQNKALAPTFISYDRRPVDMSQQMQDLCELDNFWWCRLVNNTHLQGYKKNWKNVKYFGHGRKLKSRPPHY